MPGVRSGQPLGRKSQQGPQEFLGCGRQRVNNGTQLTMLLQAEQAWGGVGVGGGLPENLPVPVKISNCSRTAGYTTLVSPFQKQ